MSPCPVSMNFSFYRGNGCAPTVPRASPGLLGPAAFPEYLRLKGFLCGTKLIDVDRAVTWP